MEDKKPKLRRETEPRNDIEKLFFKHESGNTGPLYIVFANGKTVNYKNSKTLKADGTGYYAKWFSLNQAAKIAKTLNIRLEVF